MSSVIGPTVVASAELSVNTSESAVIKRKKNIIKGILTLFEGVDPRLTSGFKPANVKR